MKKIIKHKFTKHEIILIIILILSLIVVIASHKRIGEKISKVFKLYSGTPSEQHISK